MTIKNFLLAALISISAPLSAMTTHENQVAQPQQEQTQKNEVDYKKIALIFLKLAAGGTTVAAGILGNTIVPFYFGLNGVLGSSNYYDQNGNTVDESKVTNNPFTADTYYEKSSYKDVTKVDQTLSGNAIWYGKNLVGMNGAQGFCLLWLMHLASSSVIYPGIRTTKDAWKELKAELNKNKEADQVLHQEPVN